MLSDHDVSVITGALSFLESDVDQHGWDAEPHLWGLYRGPSDPDAPINLAEVPLPPAVWHVHRAVFGFDVPHWATLEFLTRYLTGSALFKRWLGSGTRAWVGFAYCGEGLDTLRNTSDAAAADLGGVAVRALIGRDVDGRTYQIIRDRPAPERTTTTVTVGPTTSSIPASLDQLLAAALRR